MIISYFKDVFKINKYLLVILNCFEGLLDWELVFMIIEGFDLRRYL